MTRDEFEAKIGKWVAGVDKDIIWSEKDTFDTKEEVIRAVSEKFNEWYTEQTLEEFDGSKSEKKFYVGQLYPYVPMISASYIIEDIGEIAYEDLGDSAENYLINVSKEDEELLGKKLYTAISEWLKETGNEPKFYKVEKIEAIVLK